MIRSLLLAASAACVLGACATSEPAEPHPDLAAEQASIPFADLGAIRSWRPGPDDTLLIEGNGGRWYRATFFGSCPDVRFADQIGVASDATGSVDRFSGIVVNGRQCRFRTLVAIPDPDAHPAEPAQTEQE